MDGPLLGYFFCRLVFMVVFGEFAVVTALLNGHQRRWKVSGLSRAIQRRGVRRDWQCAARFPQGNHVSWVMPMNSAITAKIAQAT